MSTCSDCRICRQRISMASQVIHSLKTKNELITKQKMELKLLNSELSNKSLTKMAVLRRDVEAIGQLVSQLTNSNNSVLARVQGTLFQLEGVMKQAGNTDLSKILAKVTRMNMKLEDQNDDLTCNVSGLKAEVERFKKRCEGQALTIETMKQDFNAAQLDRKRCDELKTKLLLSKEQLHGKEKAVRKEQHGMARLRDEISEKEKKISQLQQITRDKDRVLFLVKGYLRDHERVSGGSNKLPAAWHELQAALSKVTSQGASTTNTSTASVSVAGPHTPPTPRSEHSNDTPSDLAMFRTPSLAGDAVDLQCGSPTDPKRVKVDDNIGDEFYQELLTLRSENRRLTDSNVKLEQDNRDLDFRLDDMKHKFDDLDKAFQELQNRIHEQSNLTRQLDSLQRKLNAQNDAVHRKDTELRDLKDLLRETSSHIDVKSSTIDQLKRTLDTINTELLIKLKETELLTAQLTKITEEQQTMQHTHEILISEFRNMSGQMCQKDKIIQELTKQLRENMQLRRAIEAFDHA